MKIPGRFIARRLFLLRGCFAWLLLVACQGPTLGQPTATGTIEGVITDETNAVIPGVTVRIRNVETNVTRELVTDQEGRYRAALLQPGEYEVVAELAGFSTVRRTGIRLEVGFTATVNITMKVSEIAAEVTVTGTAPITEPERVEYTSAVPQVAVENLPINGRRWENFVLLTPGVTPDGGFGLVSYRGISGLYNNNTIDGADNNQAFFSEARGRTRVVYTISQAAVKEFQVGLSNFSAEFGRAAGGTVNAVTKSGTNEFHGEGFYFVRDDLWQAREPFLPEKPQERRQQFGLSMGFPILKDRLFFFGNYDQQIRSFPYFVRTFSATFLDQPCTAPGCGATRAFFQSLSTFVPRKAHNNVALGKFDWVIGPRHNFAGQYNWHRWRSPNGIRTAPIQFNAASDNGFDGVKTDFLNFRLNSVVSAKLVNEARFQFGRDFEFQRPNAPGPGTSVSGGIAFGMPNFLPRPAFPNEKRFQWTDNLSWSLGAHTFKTGMDINYVRELMINLFQGGGVYSYGNLQNVAADCPLGASGCVALQDGVRTGKHYTSFDQAFDLRGLRGRVFFTTTDYNFYFNDTYKVTPSLTLNLGLRYEYQQLPQPEEGNPEFPQTSRFNQDTNNLGPRIGLAWDPGASHKTVLRAGYGLYYARTSNSAISNALTNNGKVFATFSFSPTASGAPVYPNVLSAPPAAGAGRPDIQFLSDDFVRPLVHMAELSVERELVEDTSVSVAYLFSRGQHLPSFRDINLPAPSAQVVYEVRDAAGNLVEGPFSPLPFFRGSRPNSAVNRIIVSESVVNASYNAFVLQASRRFRSGLGFNANFTVSKALDDGQTSQTFFGGNQLFNTLDRASEHGLSNFDVRKRFVSSFVWEPPLTEHLATPASKALLGGWKFSGIVTLADGNPLTGFISGSLASATGATDTRSPNGSGGSGRAGFLGRNSHTETGRATVDFRVTKEFRISEAKKAVFLWEAFNLFNRTNFTSFSTTQFRVRSSSFDSRTNQATVVLTQDTGFLIPRAASNTLISARDMQFGFKFIW
ncbi:MAG: TonB-dependent receptor [Acidobacteria bacterium]|nr:TonB-dependent receptor [Acidobacteriota bacterium]